MVSKELHSFFFIFSPAYITVCIQQHVDSSEVCSFKIPVWTNRGTCHLCGEQKSHKSQRMEEKSNFFRVVCKLSYGPCVLLSPVIVFKLNFNLLVCLRGKMKSNLLITHIHTHSKYKYWIVHIAEGAKKCLGPAAQTEEEKTKNEMIKPRLRRKM